jgi:NADH-quinone oxidoreductase subunit C
MRKYTDKSNAQAKSYYNDRFYVSPQLPMEDPATDEVFAQDIKSLEEKFEISKSYIQKDQLVIFIKPSDVKELMIHLKDELDYKMLCELSAVDWLSKSNEFEIFYQLLSISKRKRIRVKYFIENGQAVDSLYDVFKSSDWAEREMYDMFGIKANNHPYLKRLIMPDDWHGHPLLKSYPLIGDEAAQWYEIDTIFGTEHREVVGPEIRDTKRVYPKDTKQFARVGHEVGYGEKPSPKPTNFGDYQEEGGVPLVTKFTKENQKILKDRK